MPQIKSAIKRVRQSEKINARKSTQRSAMRSAIKKFEKAAANNDPQTQDLYKQATRAIDMFAISRVDFFVNTTNWPHFTLRTNCTRSGNFTALC